MSISYKDYISSKKSSIKESEEELKKVEDEEETKEVSEEEEELKEGDCVCIKGKEYTVESIANSKVILI